MLTGQNLLNGKGVDGNGLTFQAINPSTGEYLSPDFQEAAACDIETAVECADEAFDCYRKSDGETRAALLRAIVQELNACADEIYDRAHLETALPLVRLQGELLRTTNQLLMFADLVENGQEKEVVHAPGDPSRTPVPKPGLYLTRIPVGPVAVFGASNFPLAFSVSGGDTASALAAGCPVVVKAHPAHPGTSEIVGCAIIRAIAGQNLPLGLFSLVHGQSISVGQSLVIHPKIKSVAFTGSQKAGRSLFDLASRRSEPIPVFAEMGSVNPQFVLPGYLRQMVKDFAQAYSASLTLGAGQFCTNPGLLIAVEGDDLELFKQSFLEQLKTEPELTLLTRGIKDNLLAKLQPMTESPGTTTLLNENPSLSGDCAVAPMVLDVSADQFLANGSLKEELFGPACLIVRCIDTEQMQAVAKALDGQLSASVHAHEDEMSLARTLFDVLETKAGRLLLNDFPTGVEVSPAMHHGGPYPASTDSRFTSVGTQAIQRFLRPVCCQNFTPDLLTDV